jgi:hypothetical protein
LKSLINSNSSDENDENDEENIDLSNTKDDTVLSMSFGKKLKCFKASFSFF